MKNRIEYFDTYRFLAAMMVFFTHYLGRFTENTSRFYNTMPLSIVMKGVSGKLGVAMLCVILGYFAYKKGESTKENLLAISLKRYVYFVVICIAYYIVAFVLRWEELPANVLDALKVSVTLDKEYNSLFWTLQPMLIGSMLCYTLGKAKGKTDSVLVLLLALLLLKKEWVFNCGLGCLLAIWEEEKTIGKWMGKIWVQAVLFLIPFILIRGSESFWVYLFDDFFCFAVVLITMYNPHLKKCMDAPFWRKMNKSYFGIYIFHAIFYNKYGEFLLNMKGMTLLPFKLRLPLVFVLLTAVIVILSYPLDYLVKNICRQINKYIDRISFSL